MSEKKHIIAKLKHILYPKGGLKKTLGEEGNKFGIIKVIDEFEEVYTIKGNFPCPIDGGVEYDFTVKEEEDPKYGTTYKLLFFQSNVDMTKIPNQKEFLKKILTNKQIDALYAAYDDVLTILENEDINKLIAVKGIGSSTAHRIISKYTGAKPDAELYIRIAELGLDFTDSMVTRLKETFGNTQAIMDVLENHPYKLVKVPLVGFKKADAIALASGRFDWQSPERIAGFIENSLDMESDNGQSYIYASELNQRIIDFFGEEIVVKYPDGTSNVGKAIQMLTDSKVISMIEDESGSKARRKVYLTKVYELEKNIAIELRRISEGEPRCFMAENWREKVQEQEKNQGFKFDESQWEAIEKGLQSNVFVIGGYAGCVDCDTEFFNGYGWKKISEYAEGDKVLQWIKPELPEGNDKINIRKELINNSKTELVYPKKYIKKECDNFYHFNSGKIDQMLSEDHISLCASTKGHLHDKFIKDIRQQDRIITSFDYEGNGIELTDEEIRLMIAVMADGYFNRESTWCVMNLKKERKKERLEKLLKEANIKYDKKDSIQEGFNVYKFHAPRREKEFLPYWYNCNKHQLSIICEEIMYWDGSYRERKGRVPQVRYSTSSKMSADFIQFAYSSCGIKTSIFEDIRDGRKTCYSVNPGQIKNRMLAYGENSGPAVYDMVKSVDGYKYCFEVPSSYLVLRRNNKIFVTHNCGKTTMLKGILAALGNATIATCALSGRAAANLQGIGRNATIHKLLDYRPGSGFQYGKHAPLPYDIIILDELSMVGGELFLSLLKAIGTGSRFICLGDPGQLESIGLLCLMRDLLNDENIPSTLLTKVHRQAMDSGILEESINIREGILSFEGGIHEGVEIHGARKDFCTDFNTYRDINPSRVVAWYKKLMNSSVVESLLDIMVISPTNIRGEDSVWKLNRLIQDEINPVVNVDADDVIPINTAIDRTSLDYIHRGDVVMVRKNNYRVNDWNGEETAMFNGWRGIIKEIDNTMVYIDFAENGKVRLDRGEAAQYLLLGYACTAHKSQGSTIPVVIATFSYSAYVMLNRNILYTAITRAKEKCVVVAETNAYVKCVQTEFVSSKRTFFAEGLLNKIFKGE